MEGGHSEVVGRLEVRPHGIDTSQGVDGRAGIAGDLQPSLVDESPEGAPERWGADTCGDMALDFASSTARMCGNVVQNGFVGEEHETIMWFGDTIK